MGTFDAVFSHGIIFFVPFTGGLNPMEQKEFNGLSLAHKALLIQEFGVFMHSIQYYHYQVFLFALNAQFVEVYQNPSTRQIEKIHAVSYSDLDKYMSHIILHVSVNF